MVGLFLPPEKVFSYNEVTRDISSKYRMIKFPPEKVKEILSHCKRNGFTMTPLLTIIALKAFEDTVGVNLEHLTLSCIPVNGRPMAPGYNNSNPFGVYIGFDFYKFPKICNNITSFTKSLYKQLNQSIRSNIPFQVVGMYRYANIWDIYKLKLGRPEGRATLVVSNLGRIQTNPSQAQSSQFSIEDIWFSSCLGLVTHFLLNGITAPNGDLNIIFGTLPEYEEYFDDFISMFELIIEEEVGKGNNQLIE